MALSIDGFWELLHLVDFTSYTRFIDKNRIENIEISFTFMIREKDVYEKAKLGPHSNKYGSEFE